MKSPYYTEEKLKSTARFYLAQSMSDELLNEGLITHEEHALLTDINYEIFRSLFAEIRPKSLDK